MPDRLGDAKANTEFNLQHQLSEADCSSWRRGYDCPESPIGNQGRSNHFSAAYQRWGGKGGNCFVNIQTEEREGKEFNLFWKLQSAIAWEMLAILEKFLTSTKTNTYKIWGESLKFQFINSVCYSKCQLHALGWIYLSLCIENKSSNSRNTTSIETGQFAHSKFSSLLRSS